MPVITAGARTLIRANGVVLITKEVWPSLDDAGGAFSFKNHYFIRSAQRCLTVSDLFLQRLNRFISSASLPVPDPPPMQT